MLIEFGREEGMEDECRLWREDNGEATRERGGRWMRSRICWESCCVVSLESRS